MDYNVLRERMVYEQILRRGIGDCRILKAFSDVPRHLFVPEHKRKFAYEDYPLSIGEGQTISQPYMVALMTEALGIEKGERILEIGTGSGYQSAILFCMGADVYSIEIISSLARGAESVLDSLEYKIKIKAGDGSLGWQEYAPYDRIIVTAASPVVSPCWQEQLKRGGKIVLPLGGTFHQDLTVVEKISKDKIRQSQVCGCIFVPLVGKYGYKK